VYFSRLNKSSCACVGGDPTVAPAFTYDNSVRFSTDVEQLCRLARGSRDLSRAWLSILAR